MRLAMAPASTTSVQQSKRFRGCQDRTGRHGNAHEDESLTGRAGLAYSSDPMRAAPFLLSTVQLNRNTVPSRTLRGGSSCGYGSSALTGLRLRCGLAGFGADGPEDGRGEYGQADEEAAADGCGG